MLPDSSGIDAIITESIAQVVAGESETIAIDRTLSARQAGRLIQAREGLRTLLLDGGMEMEAWPALLALNNLEHLRIRLVKINDEHCRDIAAHFPRLRILNLPQATVSVVGITALQPLESLSQLRLGGERLDDQAAAALAQLASLRSLHLIGPRITGEGLSALSEAPRLSSLYIDDCPLPDHAWEQLFARHPHLHVHIDQQHHDRDPHAHAE